MRCPLCGSELAADAVEKCPECGWRVGAPSRLFSAIARVEDVVISVVLLSMIMLVLVQIGLRNFYSTGMSGGAEIVRHMLLWVAFLGAAIAAREGKHIRIDLAQRILKQGPKNLVDVITSLFTAIVCVMLFYASIQFIRNEYEMGTIIPFFNMKVWMLELVIPLGYGAVTLRYLARCAQSFMQLVKGI